MSVSSCSSQQFELPAEYLEKLDPVEQKMYKNLTLDQKQEYKEIFEIFDSDQSGSIQSEEIAQVMRTLGQNPTNEEVEAMVNNIDVDGNGEVDFDEFLILMVQQLKKENEAEEELVEVFNMFDKDGDGLISVHDLVARFTELGDPIYNDEAQEMMANCDVDGDGMLNFAEFVKLMLYDTEDKNLIDPQLKK